MPASPQPGISRTLIDLPEDLKRHLAAIAGLAGSTMRLEIIAAMTAWAAAPDPQIRAAVVAKYDRRPARGNYRARA